MTTESTFPTEVVMNEMDESPEPDLENNSSQDSFVLGYGDEDDQVEFEDITAFDDNYKFIKVHGHSN